ncbi:MAG: hypothetical protein IPP61_02450 [Cytophagaceae bacterium]|nr:hypothetical protein [Cytophagaceae bacterium]MBL0301217.1 hypothetical protein [Cytophagaceae bacterium]MBL0324034.1 hypothetical protein [Cytophagaceae bacterium]
MQNDAKRYYDFFYLGGPNESYAFVTENEIYYEAKFKPSNYLFSNLKDVEINVFEFVIDIAIPSKNGKFPSDSKIPETISLLIRDFFKKNSNKAILYICDSSDSKQSARKRKFDNWVQLFKGNEFFKVDAEIIDNAKNKIYSSLIIKADNPHFNAIIKYFGSLSSENSK